MPKRSKVTKWYDFCTGSNLETSRFRLDGKTLRKMDGYVMPAKALFGDPRVAHTRSAGDSTNMLDSPRDPRVAHTRSAGEGTNMLDMLTELAFLLWPPERCCSTTSRKSRARPPLGPERNIKECRVTISHIHVPCCVFARERSSSDPFLFPNPGLQPGWPCAKH